MVAIASKPNREALVLALGLLAAATVCHAAVCGDADRNEAVTVSDGVRVLRAAADLGDECGIARCDIDGSGTITVTDGVNVLRTAAGLTVTPACPTDAVIESVLGENGIFGELTKLPEGFNAPPGAPATVTSIDFAEDGFVEGRVNTVTVTYDVEAVQAQATGDTVELLVASSSDADPEASEAFALPVDSPQASVTVALDLKPELSVNQFTLKIANGVNGAVVGQVFPIVIIVIREQPPKCGNRVVDDGETCDPPGFNCAAESSPGFCDTECACVPFPGRFIDNGDGTVIDTQTRLQWEKKVGTASLPVECLDDSCSDPHDVNATYQWCRDLDHSGGCDDPNGPPDGSAFTVFLAQLNTPPCFAGHCDWRLPEVNRLGAPEFESIVDLSAPGCAAVQNNKPCTPVAFLPTAAALYWSSLPLPGQPQFAWILSFYDGVVDHWGKTASNYVRAVRTADDVPTTASE